MNSWLLKIELNGEWEECSFKTRSEAIATFVALIKDYAAVVRRAILFSPGRDGSEHRGHAGRVPKLWTN